jgi:hypothetical protein
VLVHFIYHIICAQLEQINMRMTNMRVTNMLVYCLSKHQTAAGAGLTTLYITSKSVE